MIPPQKQMTGMLGHPVAENPIDRMFDAVYAHYGLNWQFWKSDVPSVALLRPAVAGLAPLGYRGVGITVPYKVEVIPLLDDIDDDVKAIGAANYLTIENKAIEKQRRLKDQHVVMLGAGGAGRAMAVEIAWAGAAQLTLVTRREDQGREVAERITAVSGVPAPWPARTSPVATPTRIFNVSPASRNAARKGSLEVS